MSTLIGIVTFGNLDFTKLAVRAIRETVSEPVDICIVVGKPDDHATMDWAITMPSLTWIVHEKNRGFPASINDIYDIAWQDWSYDNLILVGNDVVAYPGAIDAMLACARETHYEWICASQYDAASLVRDYPWVGRYFEGERMTYTDFAARPWDLHLPRIEELNQLDAASAIEHGSIKDVRNLCLFKRSVFEKIGYADVNFWPGGYFEDNDYCTRARIAGIRACGLRTASYFHFWSRTIHQGPKGAEHHRQFRANEQFYKTKWGGSFEKEQWSLPFGGQPHRLCDGVQLPATNGIFSREDEPRIIEYWAKAI